MFELEQPLSMAEVLAIMNDKPRTCRQRISDVLSAWWARMKTRRQAHLDDLDFRRERPALVFEETRTFPMVSTWRVRLK